MSREWKPGALAMTGTYVIFCHTPEDDRTAEPRWIFDDGSGDVVSAEHLSDARPLVVIDPENRDQVERLRDLMLGHDRHEGAPCYSTTCHADRLAAALRVFASPPSEPTDPRARVMDRRENVWRLLADGDWVCVDGPDHGEYAEWARLVERGPLEVTV